MTNIEILYVGNFKINNFKIVSVNEGKLLIEIFVVFQRILPCEKFDSNWKICDGVWC